MILELRHYIAIGLIFTCIYLKYNNLCNKINIEKMSETTEIIDKINTIYKVDFKSMLNLIEICEKLQKENGLIIPGDVTMKGSITMEGTFNYLPIGTILSFNNTTAPTGWVICDGKNNTPDLRGRFIVGVNALDSYYNTIGKTGGSKTHKLTLDEMPKHTHKVLPNGNHNHTVGVNFGSHNKTDDGSDVQQPIGGTTNTRYAGNHNHGGETNNVGGNLPHENRPEYHVLMYIMKVDPSLKIESINKDTLEKKIGRAF